MLRTESGESTRNMTATAEAFFNRTIMTGGTARGELHSGFYSTVKSGRARRAGGLGGMAETAYNAAAAGSNLIIGRTDQGMVGDPNWRGPGRVPGFKEVYNFWKGSRRGRDYTHADAQRFAEEQQRRYQEANAAPTAATPAATATATPAPAVTTPSAGFSWPLAGASAQSVGRAGGVEMYGVPDRALIPSEIKSRALDATATLDRSSAERRLAVNGKGKISVEVKSDKDAKGGPKEGLAKETPIARQTQNLPARLGPLEPAPKE
jgi:hypothetical protein